MAAHSHYDHPHCHRWELLGIRSNRSGRSLQPQLSCPSRCQEHFCPFMCNWRLAHSLVPPSHLHPPDAYSRHHANPHRNRMSTMLHVNRRRANNKQRCDSYNSPANSGGLFKGFSPPALYLLCCPSRGPTLESAILYWTLYTGVLYSLCSAAIY